MHWTAPIRWTSAAREVRSSTVLPAKFLSRRMPPRGGGIYMALEIEQEQGGVLESPSFPGLPHRTNGEREDPRKVGEGFVDAADSSLTQSFSCSYTRENGSWTMDRTWTRIFFPLFLPASPHLRRSPPNEGGWKRPDHRSRLYLLREIFRIELSAVITRRYIVDT